MTNSKITAYIKGLEAGCDKLITANTDYDGKMVYCMSHGVLCNECRAKLSGVKEALKLVGEEIDDCKKYITTQTALGMLKEREFITIEEIIHRINELKQNLGIEK